MINAQDEVFIRKAISLAQSARERGNHPFGALIVHITNHIIVEARNTVETDRDITAHAEMNAIRDGFAKYTRDFLADCTLYASTEPCAMCSGALFWSGIGRIVYALPAQTLAEMINDPQQTLPIACREILSRGGHSIVVEGPVLEQEALSVHRGFWR